jgi:hypothetical protein
MRARRSTEIRGAAAAEPLKHLFSPELVRRLAGEIARVDPTFPAPAFIQRATSGLDALELLERGRHIMRALADHLPRSYPDAVDVLLRSLGPEHATDELVGAGMAPFFYLPHVLFVQERGLDHFDVSTLGSTATATTASSRRTLGFGPRSWPSAGTVWTRRPR